MKLSLLPLLNKAANWLSRGEFFRLREQHERLQVQLAGCSVAANGGDLDLSETAYGYSPAFGEIVRLWKYTHSRIESLEADRDFYRGEHNRLQKFERDHFHDVEDLTNRLKKYSRAEKYLRSRLKVNISASSLGLKNKSK